MAPINLETVQGSGILEPVETTKTSPSESLLRSQKAFYRDLPQLLRQYPGQWVAYYKSEQAFHEVDASQEPDKVEAALSAVIDSTRAAR